MASPTGPSEAPGDGATPAPTPAAAKEQVQEEAKEESKQTGQSPPAGSGGSGTGRPPVSSRIVARLSGGVVHVLLLVVALFWLLPTIGLLASSLRDNLDIQRSGWWTVFSEPAQLTVDSYATLLESEAIQDSLLNSVLITVPATVLVVVIASLAGYAFAWMEFPGRDWLLIVVIGLLVVPVQVALVPISELFGELGLFGTITGVVLFHTGFGLPFAIFLLRNFFREIPVSLLEAARLDGAGELRLFWKVVMPLGLPAIASLGIFQFLWVWNDMLVALVFAGEAKPITVALQDQTRAFSNNIAQLAPGAFLSMVIPLAVFFAFQRWFVQGVMAGAVK